MAAETRQHDVDTRLRLDISKYKITKDNEILTVDVEAAPEAIPPPIACSNKARKSPVQKTIVYVLGCKKRLFSSP